MASQSFAASNRCKPSSWAVAASTAAALFLATPMAQATPKFARQTGKACTFCHSGVPRLNDAGLAFKANGFQFPDGGEPPDKDRKDAPAH